MEDTRRCFPVDFLVDDGSIPPPSSDEYEEVVRKLATACYEHYESDENLNRVHRHSIYVGSLGPCGYVRYRLAYTSLLRRENRDSRDILNEGDVIACEERRRISSLLRDASISIDRVLGCQPHPPKSSSSSYNNNNATTSTSSRFTLLEGARVGGLALSAVVKHAMGDRAGSRNAMDELLNVGRRLSPPKSECEVLYGRAGYLQAISFVRSGTDDHGYGGGLVRRIAGVILDEGERTANAVVAEREEECDGEEGEGRGGRTVCCGGGGGGRGADRPPLPLLWKWHGRAYLGAMHGVSGILFVLLCFRREVSSIDGAMERIRTTITRLDDNCHPSGNLRPTATLGKNNGGGGDDDDRLVHVCHGAPGHVLLLVKAYEVYDDVAFLERAEDIARGVVCRRGLLRKGLGLCHGISGNAYCLLSLYRGRRLWEQRGGDGSGEKMSDKADEWLRWAHRFARFGLENANVLFNVPDHPHSLYEGIAGFVMLLRDLGDPDNSRFPCFEP